MSRGHIGAMPRTPKLADESYLDFVQTFRGHVAFAQADKAGEAIDRQVEERLNGRNAEDVSLEEVVERANELPYSRIWQRFMRTHQEMFWRRARGAFAEHEHELLSELDADEERGPGKLIYDADFVPPDYTRKEIHLQPGGYTDDPIGGIVHHYGTRVFYAGQNDQNELHEELANTVAIPEDGKVERIIDVGCSLGQATIALKQRFPDAEVWGLDVARPMVRYAHQQAVRQHVEANFVQSLAEDTGYPDDHFDIQLFYILFHEVPFEKTREILTEAFRTTRPGGKVTIFEFPNAGSDLSPNFRFIIDYDSRNNCEPYSPDLVYNDFRGAIRDAGFLIEEGPENSNHFLQTLVAVKPEA